MKVRKALDPRLLPFLLLLAVMAPQVMARPRAGSPASPATAPTFDLPAREGTVSSADLAGKLVYVDFWASWCGPCRESFPWLKTLHEQYGPKGLVVLAINLDKDRDAAMDFLDDFQAPFLVAFDPQGKTADAFKVAAMPSSYLVGPDGRILYTQAGFDGKETGKVEQLIKEALAL